MDVYVELGPSANRSNCSAYVIRHQSGAVIIDDSYNSNPSSAHASINTAVELANQAKRNLALFISQMNELGPYEGSEHQELNQLIRKLGIAHVYSVGPAAAKIGTHVESTDELFPYLQKHLKKNSLILLKSSRSWRLEKLLDRV